MKTKKKLLFGLMAAFLLAVVTCLPAAAANKAAVATINGKSYASLEAAFKSVQNNQTIVLKKSVTYSGDLTVNVNRKFNLNLNNKALIFKKNASLVIKKGTVTISKAILTQKDANGTILTVKKGAAANLKSGVYSGCINNAGTITISGGTFKSINPKTDHNTALIVNTGTMTISAGTFDGKKNTVLENHKTVTISAGTFKNSMTKTGKEDNHTGGQLVANLTKSANLKITGGTFSAGTQCLFNGTGAKLTVKKGSGKCTFSSKVFGAVMNYGTADITGGTYSSKEDWPVVWTEWSGEAPAKTTINDGIFHSEWTSAEAYGSGAAITINGGSFTTSVNEKNLAMLLSFGGTIKVNKGTFTGKGTGLYYIEKNSESNGKIVFANNSIISKAKTKYKEVKTLL